MRILILSDIHANPWALRAVEKASGSVDRILFAGDAVNYGPDPVQVIEWLNAREVVGVRGNHDHAVAFNVDPKASPAKQPLAMALRDWTRDQFDPIQIGWLLQLPRHLDFHIGDGAIELKRVEYDRSQLLEAIDRLPLLPQQINDLSDTLTHGKMA